MRDLGELTPSEYYLLLRMLAAFEQSHVGMKVTPDIARDLREANRLVGRLATLRALQKGGGR